MIPKIALVMLIAAVAGCNKETAEKAAQNQLTGNWNLASQSGGFAGKQITYPYQGNTITLQFDKPSAYTLKKNGEVQSKGDYQLGTVQSIRDHSTAPAIKLGSQQWQTFKVSNDSLIIDDNVYDGFTSLYLRIK